MDGCCKGREKKAGCGGVLRDTLGNWLRGFSLNIGSCEAIDADAWAILVGVRMAAGYGVNKLVIESDSAEVIRGLTLGYQPTRSWDNILKTCKRESKQFEEVEFKHVVRKQNRVADKLADHVLSHELGGQSFDHPPGFVRELLWEDWNGARVHRSHLSRSAS